MSRTRQIIVSVVALTALGSAGVGGFLASQTEAPTMNIGQVSTEIPEQIERDAADFAVLDKTPRRLHQWMKDSGATQMREQGKTGSRDTK
jgi:hypothetical protein